MAATLDLWAGMTGTMLPYAFSTPPANGGWLLCDGQALLAAGPHANLRARLISEGLPYGQDGSGNPRIPDLRGRVPAGKDNMGGTAAGRLTNSGVGSPGINGTLLGAAGGVDRHTLTEAQMPQHMHGPSAGMSHFMTLVSGNPAKDMGNTTGADYDWTTTTQTGYTGSSQAHPIVQPTLVANYIIKT